MAINTGEILSASTQKQLHLQENKLYIIDFFASWCKSCKKELPLLNTIYQQKKINLIGINVDKNQQKAKIFSDRLHLSFPIIYDTKQQLIENFEPIGFPTLYYVKNGEILKIISGAVDDIDKIIQKDIKELK